MDRREFLGLGAAAAGIAAVGLLTSEAARADDFPNIPFPNPGAPVKGWIDKAEALKPALIETLQSPLSLVRAVPDPALVLRFRMEVEAPAASLADRKLKQGDSVILDFGGHRTGRLSFRVSSEGRPPDAPARLRLTFGEVPTDVAEPLYPYKGQLNIAWLPDEVINVDDLPQQVDMPRRYAFRYVKIEVLNSTQSFTLKLDQVQARAITSAKTMPAPLAAGAPALFRRIDEVSVATLRDCLQTTFEDGPRRDRRLWIGDLRLQALTNYATFQANDVVKRCLYLFAAFPRDDGLVNACVYEKPQPGYAGIVIFDYAALFTVALADYVQATGDVAAGRELWPVARRQLEILTKSVGADGLFVDPGNMWLFIDWSMQLDRIASIQAVLIYALRRTHELAKRLGVEQEVADYPTRIERMVSAARRSFFDSSRGVFLSGPKRQLSWASQAWLTIAEVPESKQQAATAIRRALAAEDAVKPVTPYLYHYMVEAMLVCGMQKEARALTESYWGGMVKAGADTFWEVYDPANPLSSPYGDIHINSFCHAWSCTPAYLIRARGLLA